MIQPILINGLDRIAQTLGISEKTLRKEYLNRPGFPVCKLRAGGPWVTTHEKLAKWADMQVPNPTPMTSVEHSSN